MKRLFRGLLWIFAASGAALATLPAHADALFAIRVLREGGCGGIVPPAPPLHRNSLLDRSAAEWAVGRRLSEAVELSGYSPTSAAGLHVRGPEEAMVQLLKRSGCRTLASQGLHEMGMYRRGFDTWIVLATEREVSADARSRSPPREAPGSHEAPLTREGSASHEASGSHEAQISREAPGSEQAWLPSVARAGPQATPSPSAAGLPESSAAVPAQVPGANPAPARAPARSVKLAPALAAAPGRSGGPTPPEAAAPGRSAGPTPPQAAAPDRSAGLTPQPAAPPGRSAKVTPAPAPATNAPLSPILATRALQLVNNVRARGARCGDEVFGPAPPVTLSATLAGVAFGHASDMAENHYFEHKDLHGNTPSDRVRATGYQQTLVGENIAYGPKSVDEVVQGWLDSPDHCENIMDPRFAEMGLGYAKSNDPKHALYWVQVFAKPRQVASAEANRPASR